MHGTAEGGTTLLPVSIYNCCVIELAHVDKKTPCKVWGGRHVCAFFESKTVHNKIKNMVQAPLPLTAFSSKSSEQPPRMVWLLPFYR